MLDKSEQETIINFNKEGKEAHIFTYEKTWQRHMEGKLGLKPISVNGFGGREYAIDKQRIKMPRASRLLSVKRQKQLSDNLSGRVLRPKSANAVGKSEGENEK